MYYWVCWELSLHFPTIFFVIRRAGEAANEAIDMAQKVRGKMRRNAFRKKAEGSVLTSVEDAGTAAAILLFKIAECGDEDPSTSRVEVVRIIREEIGMKDAEEVASFAEWISKQMINPGDILRAYRPIWTGNLGPDELVEFVSMGVRVANLGSDANPEQLEIIRQLRERLLS